jgi:hypothetical protein
VLGQLHPQPVHHDGRLIGASGWEDERELRRRSDPPLKAGRHRPNPNSKRESSAAGGIDAGPIAHPFGSYSEAAGAHAFGTSRPPDAALAPAAPIAPRA